MAYFFKRYHPPGTAPGTFNVSAIEVQVPLKIHLTDYTDQDYLEKDLVTAEECRQYLHRDSITWVHIAGSTDKTTLTDLGKLFNLHTLALEDITNTGQRPKVDSFDDQLFVIMGLPAISDNIVTIDQVSFFLGNGYVISFHESESDPFEPIRKRLRNHAGKLRSKSADYLFYSLLDIVIDQAFPLFESLGDDIEALEEELLRSPTRSTLEDIHYIKRHLLLLRRMLWPQREVVNYVIRNDLGLIDEDTLIYFHDCYDHTIQIMDILESYRETTTNMLDVYLSTVSNRLNETMKVLTIIATIFMPLTFIVGLYGMNFGINEQSPWAMPELRWYYGYPIVLSLIVVVGVGMWIYFKRKHWW
ncbi:MAG: magnesium transporter [Gammaproteobacteria bacterium SG8_15]|nr:MAG: magnesium transporter [Gammaproteobacteria bacterium SG8_15]